MTHHSHPKVFTAIQMFKDIENANEIRKTQMTREMVTSISVYLCALPAAHLSDAPRRRLAVTGDSARIQDETTESSAWFFHVLGV